MKIRVNLMAHRAERRKKKKVAFFIFTGLAFLAGLVVVGIVWSILEGYIASQSSRNEKIAEENKKLDVQIREIATLKQEIDALRSRQKAVEGLQLDRNQPVYLLDELTRLTPEGIYLKSIKQGDHKINLSGWAASNERVAEFLRNLQNSGRYVDSPELIEIKLAPQSPAGIQRRVFEFSLNFAMKANPDTTAQAGQPATGAKAVPGAPLVPGAVPPAAAPAAAVAPHKA